MLNCIIVKCQAIFFLNKGHSSVVNLGPAITQPRALLVSHVSLVVSSYFDIYHTYT